jgi:hypothetical protein
MSTSPSLSSPRALFLLASLALVPLGCGDSGTDTTGSGGSSSTTTGTVTPGQGLPCEVADILSAHCQSCHSDPPKFGAPMPLLTRENLLAAPVGDGQGTVATVGELVVQRTQAGEMPPPPDMPLGAADLATLAGYVQAGMPESSDTCGGTGGGGTGGGEPLDCVPDVTLQPATPFEMPSDQSDLYVCFGLELNPADPTHITAITPLIDNTSIIHHILLLQSPTAVSAQGEACGFTNANWKLIYAWAPGTGPLVLPPEAGYPVGPADPGHYVLQIHYNNVAGLVGETDGSGVQLCTTTTLRPNDADIMAFGGMNFADIGPNEQKTLSCTTTIPALLDSYFPVNLFRSWPHMHKLGVAFDSTLIKADNTEIPLSNVPNYDFGYQIGYANDAVLDVGDSIRTRCTWNNTTSSPAGFGENTSDEMCFNFISYYPRIEAPVWSWLAPSATGNGYGAMCTWE